MEVTIFIRSGKSYMKIENTSDVDQTEYFGLYSLDESGEETLIVHGHIKVSAETPRVSSAIETVPTGTSNTFYKVVIGKGAAERYKYFPRGTLGDTTTTDGGVVSTLKTLLMIPGWENNNKHPKSLSGWAPILKKWFPHGSAEGGKKTIAYGHKIKDGEDYSDGITEASARTLLETDVTTARDAAKSFMKGLPGKPKCDANWDTLDFWGKVLITELFFNGGGSKYKNLRLSLIAKNYGTSADDGIQLTGEDAQGNMRATTWGHYQRKYDTGRTYIDEHEVVKPIMAPLETRHRFIRLYILGPLLRWKRETDTTTGCADPDIPTTIDDLDDVPQSLCEIADDCPYLPTSTEDDLLDVNTCAYEVKIEDGGGTSIETFDAVIMTELLESASDAVDKVYIKRPCSGTSICYVVFHSGDEFSHNMVGDVSDDEYSAYVSLV